jgi:hypothetical protein
MAQVYRKKAEIYKIKENIKIPLAENPSKMANSNIGDYVMIIDEKVWVVDWQDDKNKELFALANINPDFIRLNDSIFNKEL